MCYESVTEWIDQIADGKERRTKKFGSGGISIVKNAVGEPSEVNPGLPNLETSGSARSLPNSRRPIPWPKSRPLHARVKIHKARRSKLLSAFHVV